MIDLFRALIAVKKRVKFPSTHICIRVQLPYRPKLKQNQGGFITLRHGVSVSTHARRESSCSRSRHEMKTATLKQRERHPVPGILHQRRGDTSLKVSSMAGIIMHAQIMVRMAGGRAASTHTHNFPSLPTSVESDSLGFRFKYLFLKYKTMLNRHIP